MRTCLPVAAGTSTVDTDPEAEKEQTMRGLLILAAVALLLVGGLVV